ncbi:MAG: hypothetical protein JWP29_4813 [Rhodoferax sp.]|nr:hypothetical protein [Rhodoferax sp.]
MNRIVFSAAFAIGLATVGWVGYGFIGSSGLALAMTAVIAAVYVLGAWELKQFRAATASLSAALQGAVSAPADMSAWLGQVHASLQNAVRLRIAGERVALPGPALTPYLVGLLVMLGMLGTFLGMVVTFKGAVFALEGSTDLQAIRSALAEPIKGLGLAFGTSVAGVAASAMLGLLSALSRRERVDAARQLDTRIATVFRPFSSAHQREETLKALQLQAHALPDVAARLQAMMDGLERRSEQLHTQLQGQQDQFHRDVTVVYTDLAQAVGSSLRDSLAAGARAAGESIQPVVEAAMAEIARESTRVHQRVFDVTQAQLTGLAGDFGATARGVADGWHTALQTHAHASAGQVERLDAALAAFTDSFTQRSGAVLAKVDETLTRTQADQAAADQQRVRVLSGAVEAMATQLGAATKTVADGWTTALQTHADTSAHQVGRLDAALAAFTDSFAQRSGAVLAKVDETLTRTQADQAATDQQRVLAFTGALDAVATRLGAATQTVADGWTTALQTHADTSAHQVDRLDAALATFTGTFTQGSAAMLAKVDESLNATQAGQAAADQQRVLAFTAALEAMAATLEGTWQRAGTQMLDQQQAVCETLANTASAITERASQQAGQTSDDIARLLGQSEALITSRTEAEARWTQQQGQRMDALASVWRTELGALRSDEAARGQAAVERLGALQAALASQLATLGTALEAPMTRLMQTAAEVPQAAAGVISDLRQEMSRLAERDNLALEERAGLMQNIGALLQTLNQASGEQRAAIEAMVASAEAVLDQAGSRFSAALGAEAGKTEGIAAHVTGSAVELASLGASFTHGIQLFNASNEKLMDSLQSIETSIDRSKASSDEQLAYYVAQAREVIDLSISSQQDIVEDLRQLRSQQVALAERATEARTEGSAA